MGDVDPMQIRERLLSMAFIPPYSAQSQVTQKIQAMDLMKDVQLGNICVWTQPIFLWVLDSELRVLAKFPDIIGSDRECSNGVKFFPCCFYFWIWFPCVSKSIRVEGFEKAPV